MCHTEVPLIWHIEPGSFPKVEQVGRWLLAFHPVSTASEVRNTSESQKFNFFAFQQGHLPRPGGSAYQQTTDYQAGVEAVYAPHSDAQQVNNKGTVLK